MDEDAALVARVRLHPPIELLQAGLGEFGENTPFQRARALSRDDLQQADLLCRSSEQGAAQYLVDITITPEYWVEIDCQYLAHTNLLKVADGSLGARIIGA
jgi:hypothetical protein